MARALLVALVVAGLLLAGAWWFQTRLIYLPDSGDVPPASAVLPGAQNVTVRTSDGLGLDAWFVPASEPSREVAVLVAHGNAGNRAGRAPLGEALAAEGLSVLLLDYRGYGGNPGTPSEDGLGLDVRAAHDWLLEQGFPAERIICFGESVGAAFAARLAADGGCGALVLRSPFESLPAVAGVHYPFVPSFLLREELAVREHVRKVGVPTTVVYGTADSMVPAEQSRAVARAAGNLHAEVVVEGAAHNDPVLLFGEPVVTAVVDLASAAGTASAHAPREQGKDRHEDVDVDGAD